jgi:hypothetical protein
LKSLVDGILARHSPLKVRSCPSCDGGIASPLWNTTSHPVEIKRRTEFWRGTTPGSVHATALQIQSFQQGWTFW